MSLLLLSALGINTFAGYQIYRAGLDYKKLALRKKWHVDNTLEIADIGKLGKGSHLLKIPGDKIVAPITQVQVLHEVVSHVPSIPDDDEDGANGWVGNGMRSGGYSTTTYFTPLTVIHYNVINGTVNGECLRPAPDSRLLIPEDCPSVTLPLDAESLVKYLTTMERLTDSKDLRSLYPRLSRDSAYQLRRYTLPFGDVYLNAKRSNGAVTYDLYGPDPNKVIDARYEKRETEILWNGILYALMMGVTTFLAVRHLRART